MGEKINKQLLGKIVCIIFLLFPIVELLTSLTVINSFSKITIGAIYKTAITILGVIYILFLNTKNRKMYCILLSLVILLAFVSFIITTDIWTTTNLARKIPEVLKFVTFPIMAIFFICYAKNGNKIPVNAIILSVITYALVMIIAGWTGTANPTYGSIQYGHTGWYYSANELGILFGIAFPFILAYVIKSKSFASVVACGLCIYGLLSVGTKAGLLSLVISVFSLAVFCIVLFVIRKRELAKTTSLVLLFLILGFAIVFPVSPANNHLKEQYTNKLTRVSQEFENFIFSGREEKLDEQAKDYLNASTLEQIFGLKDSTKIVKNGNFKLIERDYYDILFNFGITGLFVYIYILAYVLISFAIAIIKNFKTKCNMDVFAAVVSILITISAAHICGHVFSIPTISIYLSAVLGYALSITSNENKKQSVMFVCSVGGHLTQILQIKELFEEYDYVLVTEKTEVTLDMKKKYNMGYLLHGSKQYPISYALKEVYNFFKCIIYLAIYNPDTVISTGAHTAVSPCYLAKFCGKKIIFIESFAKRNTPTKTGKIIYPIADVFVIQWETLKEYYLKAETWGWIY